jgi:hypothetical protein
MSVRAVARQAASAALLTNAVEKAAGPERDLGRVPLRARTFGSG